MHTITAAATALTLGIVTAAALTGASAQAATHPSAAADGGRSQQHLPAPDVPSSVLAEKKTHTVSVRLLDSEIQLSAAQVHAGLVTIRVSSPTADHILQIFRPHKQVSLQQVLDDIGRLDRDPATAVRALQKEATFFGGAEGAAGFAVTLTQKLTAGTYYLLDYARADQGAAAVKSLRVVGEAGDVRLRGVSATLRMVDVPDAHRFRIDGKIDGTGSFLVQNRSMELHEASFGQVKPGTTDAQIQAILDAEAAGQPAPPDPFVRDAGGLKVISPGREVLVHIDHLSEGRYAILCFIPDADTGLPHAYVGMHLVANFDG